MSGPEDVREGGGVQAEECRGQDMDKDWKQQPGQDQQQRWAKGILKLNFNSGMKYNIIPATWKNMSGVFIMIASPMHATALGFLFSAYREVLADDSHTIARKLFVWEDF